MTQMTELIVASATGMMTVLVGIAVKAMKDYLIQKGGEKAVRIAEILAKNAVHAVEQVASETGYRGKEKLEQAKLSILTELKKYKIPMSDQDLDLFVDAAVKQMNEAWQEQEMSKTQEMIQFFIDLANKGDGVDNDGMYGA